MFTWMWTRKFTRMANRVQELEVTREENLFSSNLSVRTLETAPDFWQRQHQAFSYLDRQLNRMNRRTRVWGGLAVLAIMADAAIVVGGLALFSSFQQHQAAHQIQQVASAPTQLDRQMESLATIAMDPNQPLSDRMQASELLNQYLQGQGRVTQIPQAPTATTASSLHQQLEVIQRSGLQADPYTLRSLTTLLSNSNPMVRASAAQALGQVRSAQGISDAMAAMNQRLLNESDDSVRAALIESLARIVQRG